MKYLTCVTLAFALAITTAQAAIPTPILPVNGTTFYSRCTNPKPDHGPEVVGICAAYVSGIADGLSDAGLVCIRPGMTPERLLPIALGWMNARSQNGWYPAAIQIKTGMMVLFPCHRGNTRSAHQATDAAQMMENATKFIAFLNAAKTLLAGVF